MSSRFAVPSQPLSFDPRILDDETLFGSEERANDDVLRDIIEQLDLWGRRETELTDSKVKLESSESVRSGMDPMFATTSEEDGDFALPTMASAAAPEHNTPYLNCPLTTWTDLDIDALPIDIEDLNLPDVVVPVEPVTESIPGSSGAKSDICQKSDDEGEEEEEVNGGDADLSDEDYTPESERRPAASTRRRVGRPRGSTSRNGNNNNRVKAGRVSKRTRIVQSRIDSEVLNNGQRLYEAKPFDDPVKERCRRNAINAKLNRERKAKEKEALARQMSLLRKENRRAQTEADTAERRAEEAERRAADAEAELERLRAVLRENGLGCKTALRPHDDNYSEKMDCSCCGGGN